MKPSLALTPRRAAATAKKRWWLNQPSWERNVFFHTVESTWVFGVFFVLKKLHLRIQCVCFFLPQKTQLFNVRKTSYWIRSLLERSDFSRLDSKILVKKTRGCHCWNASPLKKSRKKLILHHLFCLERKPQSTRRAPIVDNFQHHHRLYKIADVVTTSAQKWWPLSVKSQQHPKPNKMLGSCGVESIRCCFWETMAGSLRGV